MYNIERYNYTIDGSTVTIHYVGQAKAMSEEIRFEHFKANIQKDADTALKTLRSYLEKIKEQQSEKVIKKLGRSLSTFFKQPKEGKTLPENLLQAMHDCALHKELKTLTDIQNQINSLQLRKPNKIRANKPS